MCPPTHTHTQAHIRTRNSYASFKIRALLALLKTTTARGGCAGNVVITCEATPLLGFGKAVTCRVDCHAVYACFLNSLTVLRATFQHSHFFACALYFIYGYSRNGKGMRESAYVLSFQSVFSLMSGRRSGYFLKSPPTASQAQCANVGT